MYFWSGTPGFLPAVALLGTPGYGGGGLPADVESGVPHSMQNLPPSAPFTPQLLQNTIDAQSSPKTAGLFSSVEEKQKNKKKVP